MTNGQEQSRALIGGPTQDIDVGGGQGIDLSVGGEFATLGGGTPGSQVFGPLSRTSVKIPESFMTILDATLGPVAQVAQAGVQFLSQLDKNNLGDYETEMLELKQKSLDKGTPEYKKIEDGKLVPDWDAVDIESDKINQRYGDSSFWTRNANLAFNSASFKHKITNAGLRGEDVQKEWNKEFIKLQTMGYTPEEIMDSFDSFVSGIDDPYVRQSLEKWKEDTTLRMESAILTARDNTLKREVDTILTETLKDMAHDPSGWRSMYDGGMVDYDSSRDFFFDMIVMQSNLDGVFPLGEDGTVRGGIRELYEKGEGIVFETFNSAIKKLQSEVEGRAVIDHRSKIEEMLDVHVEDRTNLAKAGSDERLRNDLTLYSHFDQMYDGTPRINRMIKKQLGKAFTMEAIGDITGNPIGADVGKWNVTFAAQMFHTLVTNPGRMSEVWRYMEGAEDVWMEAYDYADELDPNVLIDSNNTAGLPSVLAGSITGSTYEELVEYFKARWTPERIGEFMSYVRSTMPGTPTDAEVAEHAGSLIRTSVTDALDKTKNLGTGSGGGSDGGSDNDILGSLGDWQGAIALVNGPAGTNPNPSVDHRNIVRSLPPKRSDWSNLRGTVLGQGYYLFSMAKEEHEGLHRVQLELSKALEGGDVGAIRDAQARVDAATAALKSRLSGENGLAADLRDPEFWDEQWADLIESEYLDDDDLPTGELNKLGKERHMQFHQYMITSTNAYSSRILPETLETVFNAPTRLWAANGGHTPENYEDMMDIMLILENMPEQQRSSILKTELSREDGTHTILNWMWSLYQETDASGARLVDDPKQWEFVGTEMHDFVNKLFKGEVNFVNVHNRMTSLIQQAMLLKDQAGDYETGVQYDALIDHLKENDYYRGIFGDAVTVEWLEEWYDVIEAELATALGVVVEDLPSTRRGMHTVEHPGVLRDLIMNSKNVDDLMQRMTTMMIMSGAMGDPANQKGVKEAFGKLFGRYVGDDIVAINVSSINDTGDKKDYTFQEGSRAIRNPDTGRLENYNPVHTEDMSTMRRQPDHVGNDAFVYWNTPLDVSGPEAERDDRLRFDQFTRGMELAGMPLDLIEDPNFSPTNWVDQNLEMYREAGHTPLVGMREWLFYDAWIRWTKPQDEGGAGEDPSVWRNLFNLDLSNGYFTYHDGQAGPDDLTYWGGTEGIAEPRWYNITLHRSPNDDRESGYAGFFDLSIRPEPWMQVMEDAEPEPFTNVDPGIITFPAYRNTGDNPRQDIPLSLTMVNGLGPGGEDMFNALYKGFLGLELVNGRLEGRLADSYRELMTSVADIEGRTNLTWAGEGERYGGFFYDMTIEDLYNIKDENAKREAFIHWVHTAHRLEKDSLGMIDFGRRSGGFGHREGISVGYEGGSVTGIGKVGLVGPQPIDTRYRHELTEGGGAEDVPLWELRYPIQIALQRIKRGVVKEIIAPELATDDGADQINANRQIQMLSRNNIPFTRTRPYYSPDQDPVIYGLRKDGPLNIKLESLLRVSMEDTEEYGREETGMPQASLRPVGLIRETKDTTGAGGIWEYEDGPMGAGYYKIGTHTGNLVWWDDENDKWITVGPDPDDFQIGDMDSRDVEGWTEFSEWFDSKDKFLDVDLIKEATGYTESELAMRWKLFDNAYKDLSDREKKILSTQNVHNSRTFSSAMLYVLALDRTEDLPQQVIQSIFSRANMDKKFIRGIRNTDGTYNMDFPNLPDVGWQYDVGEELRLHDDALVGRRGVLPTGEEGPTVKRTTKVSPTEEYRQDVRNLFLQAPDNVKRVLFGVHNTKTAGSFYIQETRYPRSKIKGEPAKTPQHDDMSILMRYAREYDGKHLGPRDSGIILNNWYKYRLDEGRRFEVIPVGQREGFVEHFVKGTGYRYGLDWRVPDRGPAYGTRSPEYPVRETGDIAIERAQEGRHFVEDIEDLKAQASKVTEPDEYEYVFEDDWTEEEVIKKYGKFSGAWKDFRGQYPDKTNIQISELINKRFPYKGTEKGWLSGMEMEANTKARKIVDKKLRSDFYKETILENIPEGLETHPYVFTKEAEIKFLQWGETIKYLWKDRGGAEEDMEEMEALRDEVEQEFPEIELKRLSADYELERGKASEIDGSMLFIMGVYSLYTNRTEPWWIGGKEMKERKRLTKDSKAFALDMLSKWGNEFK